MNNNHMTPEDKLKAVINKHVGYADQEVYDAINEYAKGMYSEEELQFVVDSITLNKSYTKEDLAKIKTWFEHFKDAKKNGGGNIKPMYSEQQVIELLQQYRLDLSSGATPVLGDTTPDWLNQHK